MVEASAGGAVRLKLRDTHERGARGRSRGRRYRLVPPAAPRDLRGVAIARLRADRCRALRRARWLWLPPRAMAGESQRRADRLGFYRPLARGPAGLERPHRALIRSGRVRAHAAGAGRDPHSLFPELVLPAHLFVAPGPARRPPL